MSAHSRHVRGFAFICCEMRASNLSLVVATGYCLLWAPGTLAQVIPAQDTPAQVLSARGPSCISIQPSTLTPGKAIIVLWAAPTYVSVYNVNLVGVDQPTSTAEIAAPCTFHGHLAAKYTAVLLTVLKTHHSLYLSMSPINVTPIPTPALLPQLLHLYSSL